MPIISIDPITKMWLIDGVSTEVSAASEVVGPTGANGIPGSPAMFYEFTSVENLPTLLSEGSNAHFNKAFLDSEGYLYFPQGSNNLSLSPARPYFKTSFSIKGDKGDTGDQGLKGETGAGLVLKGFRTTWEALPITGQDGDGYVLRLKEEGGEFIIDTVGYLWVYDSNGTTITDIFRPFKFVGPIQGERGEGLELRTDSGYIQFKYPSDTVWTNLIALSALTGQAATIEVGEVVTLAEDQVATITEGGTPQNKILNFGLPKGKSIKLRKGSTHIQWAIDGTDVWYDIILISDLLGPQGLAATVQVGSVSASEPGSAPQITETGTPQEKVLNFVLPRGIAGTNGQEISLQVADGYIQWKLTNAVSWTNLVALSEFKGDKGDAGTAATISVGTVTASEPGSAPQITEGGTANARVFNFVLPRGLTGPSGLAVSLQKTTTHIQWRLGTGTWSNLIALSEITGPASLSETYIGIFNHGGSFLKSALNGCRAVRIEIQSIQDDQGANIRNITHASTTRDIANVANGYYNYIECTYLLNSSPATNSILAVLEITDSSNVSVSMYKTGLSTNTYQVRVFGIY